MEKKSLQMVAESNKTLKYDNLSLFTKKVLPSIDLNAGIFTAPISGKYLNDKIRYKLYSEKNVFLKSKFI